MELDRGIDKRIDMRLTNFVWMNINGSPRVRPDEQIVRFMLKVEAEWETSISDPKLSNQVGCIQTSLFRRGEVISCFKVS